MKKKVQVLMSTYNGEKYISEQIDTILNQESVDVSLLVRDDGSTDDTCRILEKYKVDGRLEWFRGNNIGSAKSFINLLHEAIDADYYAFADQDDVWAKDKIYAGVSMLQEKQNEYKLYFCNKEIVDQSLNVQYSETTKYDLSLEKAFVRNVASGCTMIFNRRLKEKSVQYTPEYAWMHDAWLFRLCLLLGGDVVQDARCHIKYRQHNANVVGFSNYADLGTVKSICQIASLVKHRNNRDSKMADEMLRLFYSDFSDDNRLLLAKLSQYTVNKDFKNELLMSDKFKVENEFENKAFRILVKLNRY